MLAVDEIVTEKWLKERPEANHQKQETVFHRKSSQSRGTASTEESGSQRATFMVPTLFLKNFLPGITA